MKNTETKKENSKKENSKKENTKRVSKNSNSKSSVADGLRELFMDSLKDIYWAEKALTKALPKMAKKATSDKLVSGLEQHLAETEEQIKRIESIFEILGKKASAKKCDAMEGLIEEAKSIMEETAEGPVRDAGIIAAAQKVEHYEIATYGTLIAFAKTLGEDKVVTLLMETLEEEKQADQSLTDAAYNSINFEAVEESEEEEDNQDDDDNESKEKNDDEKEQQSKNNTNSSRKTSK